MNKKWGTASTWPAALSCLCIGPTSLAVDLDAPFKFEIAAQKLATALVEVSRQADVQVVSDTNVVARLDSPGANGQMSLKAALRSVLAGTALGYTTPGGNVIAVGSFAGGGAGDGPQAAESKAEPTLEEVVVTAIHFRYNEATSALKLPLSLKDTPQTVKAVTEDVIEFSSIRKFEDVYKIDASGGTSHALDDFARNYYRGFRQESDNAIKIDGFRLTGAMNLDLAPFERFEIVKGATSTLYGQNSIAGTLNAISKMPKSEFGGEVKAELGSFEYYRGDIDVYGPLTQDGALSYRLIGAYTDSGSFLDLANRKVSLVAPGVRYQFSSGTTVTARAIYQKNDSRHHFGHGLILGDDGELREPDVRRSTFAGMNWNHVGREALFALTTLEHKFDNGWQLRASGQYNSVKGDLTEFIPAGLGAGGDSFVDATYARDDDDKVYAGEVMLFGDIEIGGRPQTLFFGVDYSSQKSDSLTATDYYSFGQWNIYSPNAWLIPSRRLTDAPAFIDARDRSTEYGVTMQALLRPTDALTLVLGGRYTRNDMERRTREAEMAALDDFQAVPFGPADVIDTGEFTAQLGVTYAVTKNLNLYASYGETFEPQFGRVPGGMLIAPERGEAWELGLKGDLADRLSYSLAAFDMKRTNIAEVDITNPGFLVPLGSQRSRGVEFDFQGEIVGGWNVYGSFAVMKAKFSGEFEGLQPVNAPRFGASLFTSYEFQEGALRGFGIGGGVVHKHGRRTFDDNRFGFFEGPRVFDFGDFTEVDLRLFYTLDHWRLQLSGTNVTNEKYYSPTFNTFAYALQVNPATAVVASVAYSF